jgi:hypothetical protein
VSLKGDAVTVDLQTRGDAELELWAAQRQRGALERALDRPVLLQARQIEDADEAAPPPARRGARPEPRIRRQPSPRR